MTQRCQKELGQILEETLQYAALTLKAFVGAICSVSGIYAIDYYVKVMIGGSEYSEVIRSAAHVTGIVQFFFFLLGDVVKKGRKCVPPAARNS